ncbi:MAG: nucleotidyltransferase domain-containing protein [Spirochaetota bacterium]
MKFPHAEIDDAVITSLARKYRIKELALFGSILRDDFNDRSDIDILVEFDPEVDYSLFDLMEIKEEFSKVLKRHVDLIEKAGLRNPYRKEKILRTARTIYAA